MPLLYSTVAKILHVTRFVLEDFVKGDKLSWQVKSAPNLAILCEGQKLRKRQMKKVMEASSLSKYHLKQ